MSMMADGLGPGPFLLQVQEGADPRRAGLGSAIVDASGHGPPRARRAAPGTAS